jgi:hypothetical protein
MLRLSHTVHPLIDYCVHLPLRKGRGSEPYFPCPDAQAISGVDKSDTVSVISSLCLLYMSNSNDRGVGRIQVAWCHHALTLVLVVSFTID